MECDRRIVVYIVWIFLSVSVGTFGIEDEKNVSTASVRLEWFRRFHSKMPVNWQLRSSDVGHNYTNCSGLKILVDELQPKYSATTSFIQKCCPIGQTYEQSERKCTDDNSTFDVHILNATFYENCIEDDESAPNLEYKIRGACEFEMNDHEAMNQQILYSRSYGDLLYVLQNGSLLTVNENYENFDIHNHYCLDVDRNGGFLYAIVCDRRIDLTHKNRVLHAEAYLYSTCLLISVPCLLITAFFYIKIDELRDSHGKSLASHSVSLAIAYILLSIVQLQPNVSLLITYCIQYFLLACYCWLNVLCFDICFQITYIYIKKVSCGFDTEKKYFPLYTFISVSVPIIPVWIASARQISGIPLSYIKGQHNVEYLTENYFVLPASILLVLCFISLLITFYAFQRRKPILPDENVTPQIINDYLEFYKLKQTAQSSAFLFGVMAICMVIEVAVSHINAAITAADSTTTTMSPFAFFDILIALQGVFIFMIFVCSPKPLKIIKRWWVASGSLDVAAYAELEALKKTTNHT